MSTSRSLDADVTDALVRFESAKADPITKSNLFLQLLTQNRLRHVGEFVLPERSVVGVLIERAQMCEFVDESLKAVMLRVAADQDGFAMLERHPADLAPVDALNHGLAHQVDLPSRGHWFGPD